MDVRALFGDTKLHCTLLHTFKDDFRLAGYRLHEKEEEKKRNI
jgi:hypothetical protein